ncbi:cysteine proteinase [Sodiomyces alkalinus F11]|uniref:Cysteine proteinase n=1 Tax=Sodiomyces alkalinus (strain CBS 110278 / VKM F-3762 / F11) TaxID=1314773 RepID=A0A3N2Q359_SODAK|nr:cysteine proteinase [Sodiomyces alkalinus F11]ROT41108.1 cysteine proteinase [Sodiomyces alkalinus F11]
MPFRKMARHFGDSLSPHQTVLSYHDITLTYEDIRALKSDWLTDNAEGGSHWSLLLVSAIDGVAFHYDSLGGGNYQEARLATQKMSEILGRGPLRFLNLEDTPQQENGSDCGVFVCILMRHLLVKRLLSANARQKVSMSMANKLIDSQGGRKEMLKIIDSFRKEGERRRSYV